MKLKDDVLFHVVNKKVKLQFDFDLSDYYDKKVEFLHFHMVMLHGI